MEVIIKNSEILNLIDRTVEKGMESILSHGVATAPFIQTQSIG